MRRLNSFTKQATAAVLLWLAAPLVALAECGDVILDVGETCDDGNTANGDGCSSVCQVEPGWSCTLPVEPDNTNLVADPGFEAGTPNVSWSEASIAFGTPICDLGLCGESFQRSGDHWAWFGGVIVDWEEAMLSQTLVFPTTAYELSFWIRVDLCDSAMDYIEVLIDDTQVWYLDGDDPACGAAMYSEAVIDIAAFADGAQHEVSFHAETFSVNEDSSDFHIDDIFLPQGPLEPLPSVCEESPTEEVIFSDGFEL